MNFKDVGMSPISGLRRRKPVCVQATTTLLATVEAMDEENRGAAAIVDEKGVLIGIFSIRDLIRRIDHSNTDWHSTPVSEAMTPDPVCVAGSDSLSVALQLMEKGTFRHLPRVDAEGKPTAILSVRDILAHVSKHFPKEFVNLPPDPSNKAKQPWGG